MDDVNSVPKLNYPLVPAANKKLDKATFEKYYHDRYGNSFFNPYAEPVDED